MQAPIVLHYWNKLFKFWIFGLYCFNNNNEIPTIPKFPALKEDGDSREYLVSGSGEEDECAKEHDIS